MYKIVGADQKEYGPVTADQIRDWVAQGRANGQTLVRLEDGQWKPLATFPEFASLFSAGVPPLAAPPGIISASVQPKSNSMAITGLVFSILGLVCCHGIGPLLGLIFSCIGLSQINQNPQQYTTGKGLPIAGIVLSVLGFAFLAILFFTGAFAAVFKNFPRF